MENTVQTPMEAFFPDGRIYEYFLQRLRLVASQQTLVLQVRDIHDVSDTGTDLPCIEVVLRIPGLKIHNPVTGKPMLSTDWIRNHFEGRPSQKAFQDSYAEYFEISIPADHPEANLKPKFKHYRDGAPGDLPTRADLYVSREGLIQHLTAARKWLRMLQRPKQEFSKEDRTAFLNEISHPMFWWAKYVQEGSVTLTQIARHSPRATAIEILALTFGKSVEAIEYRFRREV